MHAWRTALALLSTTGLPDEGQQMNNRKGGGQRKDNASSQWGRVPLHTVVVTQLPAGWNKTKTALPPRGSAPAHDDPFEPEKAVA